MLNYIIFYVFFLKTSHQRNSKHTYIVKKDDYYFQQQVKYMYRCIVHVGVHVKKLLHVSPSRRHLVGPS